MHYIKDLFEGNETEHTHNKFVRYSKGNFTGPLLKAKFTKQNVKLYTSFHFIDEILMMLAEHLGNIKVNIKGSIIWNQDLSEKLHSLGIMYSKVTKARGIFKYVLDNEVQLKEFVDLFIDYNLLVNFKLEGVSVVMKPNLPKPNKEITSDFCKLTLPIEMENVLRDEFLFDIKEKCKEVVIAHEIVVDDIILPEDEDLDFEMKRRLAKRKGKITRHTSINKEDNIDSSRDFLI